MENQSRASAGNRSAESAACAVGDQSTPKPVVQGQPLKTNVSTGAQHSTESAHASAGQSSAAADKMPASADQLKQQASEKASELKDSARQSVEQVRQQAGEAATRLKEQGTAILGQQKERLVEEVSHVGQVVRQAANKLHDENDDNIATYVDAVADQIDRAAGYLRERDLSSLMSDMSSLARPRPELFAGGMFVAGLTLARFLKASSPSQSRSSGSQSHLRAAGSQSHASNAGSQTRSSSSPNATAYFQQRDVTSPSSIHAGPGLATTTGPTMASMPRATGAITANQEDTCPTNTASTSASTPRQPR